MLRVTDIRNGRIATQSPFRVASQIEAAHARTRLGGGELLLTLVGTVGETAVVPSHLRDWNVARAIAVIPVADEVGAHWVKLALEAPAARELIEGRLNTTVQATLNLKDVAQLPVLMPPKEERAGISAVIGALEKRIELNRNICQTLQDAAQATFRSWFLDFEHGWTVDDWEKKPLDSVAEFLNGLALQKYPASEGQRSLPVIKIAQLRAGHTKSADRAGTDVPDAYVISDGDLLFSWSGSLEVDFWCGGQGALNQHLFKVTSGVAPLWYAYLWTKHHLPEFRAIAANKATTMGHIQRKHLTAAEVLLPPPKVMTKMDEVMRPLVSHMIQLRLEARTLADLRDELLPKLLSGEITIGDATVTA
jgi:type I restriction enzyme S subunit